MTDPTLTPDVSAAPLAEEMQRLREELAMQPCDSDIDLTCWDNWPADPASWCQGCLSQAASDAIATLTARANELQQALSALRDGQALYLEHETLKYAYQELEARAEEAELSHQWQPIETAPKDGRWVLVSDGVDVFRVRWSDGYGESPHWCLSSLLMGGTCGVVNNARAKGWMPLPAPPRIATPGD